MSSIFCQYNARVVTTEITNGCHRPGIAEKREKNYGHFNLVLKNFIIERQGGESVWKSIISKAGCLKDFDKFHRYNDAITGKLIGAAVSLIGLPREPFLEMLGEFYLSYLQTEGFDEALRNLGSNILEFLQNLDSMHAYAKKEYPEMVAPSFRCEEDSLSDRMTLHYYSAKEGLFACARGLIKSAAKTYYKMDLRMDIVCSKSVHVAKVNGFREHIIVNIVATKIPERRLDERPPTFIAQTKKHSEKQILKEDVEAVKKKLEQIKSKLGENALPLQRKRSVHARWKMVAQISRLHRGFIPNYPESMAINPRMFIEIFPFHVMFDVDMKIVQSGIRIQMLMPAIRSRHETLTNFFTLRYPSCVDLTYENIQRFVCCPFTLEFKKDKLDQKWKDRPALQIKGQMFLLRDKGYYLYMASPVIQNWQDLEQRTIKLADVPMWDTTRDVIFSDSECRVRTDIKVRSLSANKAERTALTTLGGKEADDTSGLKNKLQKFQKELEIEQKKNDALYKAYLPKDIVDIVQKGEMPSGKFYHDVTAMFCDVVHFLPMVAKCSPGEVIGMLNSLHETFDKITKLHDTQKVESIGDAYMVIAGIGENKVNHAKKIANTALGMLLLSKEVVSPLDEEPVQIRAGIHTGSIVTGVIGQDVPRFLVMGETTVVASKLESHSVPGKIHVSPTTHKALEKEGFTFEDRGLIELKGYGPLQTFFLTGNNRATDKELCGRQISNKTGVKIVNEKKNVNARDKSNKVHPVKKSPSSGAGSHPTSKDSSHPPLKDSNLHNIQEQMV